VLGLRDFGAGAGPVNPITNPDSGARHEEPRRCTATSPSRTRSPTSSGSRSRAALYGRGLTAPTTIVPLDLTRPECWAEYPPAPSAPDPRLQQPGTRDAPLVTDTGYPVTVIDGDAGTIPSAMDIRAQLTTAAAPERRSCALAALRTSLTGRSSAFSWFSKEAGEAQRTVEAHVNASNARQLGVDLRRLDPGGTRVSDALSA
jgi:hypothetical protein